jgi:hypothetical protein
LRSAPRAPWASRRSRLQDETKRSEPCSKRLQTCRVAAQPAKFFAAKSQFARLQNASTYLARALR